MIPENIVRWLNELENTSVRYRTMVELLRKSQDEPEVIECKNQIETSDSVRILLSKMHSDGYWL